MNLNKKIGEFFEISANVNLIPLFPILVLQRFPFTTLSTGIIIVMVF